MNKINFSRKILPVLTSFVLIYFLFNSSFNLNTERIIAELKKTNIFLFVFSIIFLHIIPIFFK